MMKKLFIALISLMFFISNAGCTSQNQNPQSDQSNQPDLADEQNSPDQQVDQMPYKDLITVTFPLVNAEIKSPLIIEGKARGPWFWEAAFPVKLVDENNQVITQDLAWAKEDWMTTDFVSFHAELTFDVSTITPATLVLEKSNPSGLPEKADEIRIPLVLMPKNNGGSADVKNVDDVDKGEISIKLFYYDPSKDSDKEGELFCGEKGLTAVERKIPISKTPIQDAVRLLLKGELTSEEKAQGIITGYPLEEFELVGVSMHNGEVTLQFNDPRYKTGGGSCHADFLWKQIEATVKQFSGVTSVKFMPEDLFQP